jgi:hypothetical protein
MHRIHSSPFGAELRDPLECVGQVGDQSSYGEPGKVIHKGEAGVGVELTFDMFVKSCIYTAKRIGDASEP